MSNSNQQSKNTYVCELVRWKGNSSVSSEQMIEAMSNFARDVKQLPGFIEETLYQEQNNEWLAIYYWETAEHAEASNQLVANMPSFESLIALLDSTSVQIDILQALQYSKK